MSDKKGRAATKNVVALSSCLIVKPKITIVISINTDSSADCCS